MKVYDISQESLHCEGFAGMEPARSHRTEEIAKGADCNFTVMWQTAHNGTHVDAPCHCVQGGKSMEQVDIQKFVGNCVLLGDRGVIDAAAAKRAVDTGHTRILYKHDVEISEEAAQVFAAGGIDLLGNPSPTVGPRSAPQQVHRILLAKEVVLLEGIRAEQVPEGEYLLCAAPVVYQGADGGPCRAVLIQL